MIIEWDDKYNTNIPAIDKQHKEIVDQLNKLHASISKGEANETIFEILEFLKNYSSRHFSFEEKCFDEYQCPFAKENKDAHKVFIEKFDKIEAELSVQGTDTAAAINIYRELKDWVQSHILKIDSHLRKCVTKPKPAKTSPQKNNQ